MSIQANEQLLNGNWKAGWALDIHTTSSTLLPDRTFENVYTPLGETLNKLKYHKDSNALEPIVDTATEFLKTRHVTPFLKCIIPVPPSDYNREIQPVEKIARLVANNLGVECQTDYLIKVRDTSQLKNETDHEVKKQILKGAFKVADDRYKGKKVLLLDDIFDSGATISEITNTLLSQGHVDNVYVLCITRTRVSQ